MFCEFSYKFSPLNISYLPKFIMEINTLSLLSGVSIADITNKVAR